MNTNLNQQNAMINKHLILFYSFEVFISHLEMKLYNVYTAAVNQFCWVNLSCNYHICAVFLKMILFYSQRATGPHLHFSGMNTVNVLFQTKLCLCTCAFIHFCVNKFLHVSQNMSEEQESQSSDPHSFCSPYTGLKNVILTI